MTNLKISRRQLIAAGSIGCATLAVSKLAYAAAPAVMSVDRLSDGKILSYLGSSALTLPELPFEQNALEPVVSAQTIGIHYGKHHRTYFENLHKLINGTSLASLSLEQIVLESHGRADLEDVFNNASQAWNHNFYWKSISPLKTVPDDLLRSAIASKFGSIDELSHQLGAVAASQFGSGWTWLVIDRGELSVTKTSNAENPFTHGGMLPLLTIDVWEHAYYLDYQNRRPDYLTEIIEKHINWTFASKNYANAKLLT